ncbi:AAA family ATPase [Pseudorhodoplanes sinuspersici]|uniref:DNA-binding protein n=1 Tax=Pseudorhodoplanes sinuspersici TaxID=1235591 RepID=A0A1W6ZNF9_9HYPH|nr:bifunctional aminoglycoside phosphotransferase/ATP-binding protein [Pseudorhodoplanes sinuspersici]ARP98324.1 DNA-binding protein [Pseudorhodoplanes sinuspersici]
MSAPVQSQQDVFAFLADPRTHEGRDVRRIDTHGAAVFLVGERVLKVKRAVRFPFLDYSTLEKRKTACEAELEVNRPFAPQIYRGVVAITKNDAGRLSLGGDGTPVEWALEMQRFDENATLDRLADDRKIDTKLADGLGRVVAAAHRKTPLADTEKWIAALGDYVEQNDEAFREWPALFPATEAKSFTEASRRLLKALQPLLRQRGTMGLIRRGHGDLHLGNIVLIDGKPVLFDAVEFDPVVASGDVFYDLAFLLMDLVERNLRPQANIVLNRYLTDTQRDDDLDALAALPFFMAMRAAIRAKVTAAKLVHADDAKKKGIEDSARAYFVLATTLIAPPKPMLIAVGGLSGTGKSVLARALAAHILPEPGAVVLRSDVMRKRLFDAAEADKLPQEAYKPEVSETIYNRLYEQAQRVLAAGHSAIVDAVFAKAEEREPVAELAKASSVPFHGFFLTADLETRIRRVGSRINDASDADAAVVRQQAEYDLGAMTWTPIDAAGTPEDTLARTRKALDQ